MQLLLKQKWFFYNKTKLKVSLHRENTPKIQLILFRINFVRYVMTMFIVLEMSGRTTLSNLCT